MTPLRHSHFQEILVTNDEKQSHEFSPIVVKYKLRKELKVRFGLVH